MNKIPAWGDGAHCIVTMLCVVALLGVALMIGLPRSEVAECKKWSDQAKEYRGNFYLAQWQADQCAAHNITIDAPIK